MLGFISAGVKQSVQSYIVGQTGVLSANLKTVVIPSTLPATTSNTVTTVILAGTETQLTFGQ